MEIAGNAFIVTGGASGLGEATVRRLHRCGGKVLIADLNEERAQKIVDDLANNVAFARTDVSSEQDAMNAVRAVQDHLHAPLRGLVNCAGIGFGERVLSKDGMHRLDSFIRTLSVNTVGSFNMARVAAEAINQESPGGSGERGVIVNTASAAAFDGQVGQVAYSASKAAIVGMTLPLARDLARHGIRVMAIAPGLFMTPLSEGAPPELQEALTHLMQFPKRWGQPDEFATLVQHIVENEMLNGETIRLDGAIRLPAR